MTDTQLLEQVDLAESFFANARALAEDNRRLLENEEVREQLTSQEREQLLELIREKTEILNELWEHLETRRESVQAHTLALDEMKQVRAGSRKHERELKRTISTKAAENQIVVLQRTLPASQQLFAAFVDKSLETLALLSTIKRGDELFTALHPKPTADLAASTRRLANHSSETVDAVMKRGHTSMSLSRKIFQQLVELLMEEQRLYQAEADFYTRLSKPHFDVGISSTVAFEAQMDELDDEAADKVDECVDDLVALYFANPHLFVARVQQPRPVDLKYGLESTLRVTQCGRCELLFAVDDDKELNTVEFTLYNLLDKDGLSAHLDQFIPSLYNGFLAHA